MDNNIIEFESYLIERRKSQNTITAYVKDIELYFRKYNDVSIRNINNYIRSLETEKISPTTINRKLASLDAYVKFIKRNDIDTKQFKLPIHQQAFKEDRITLGNVKRIIAQAEKAEDVRAVTLMKALLLTGARISEILQLKIDDIVKKKIEVTGKGNKKRVLLIPKALTKQFKKHLIVRSGYSENYLFSGQRGVMTRSTAHQLIKKYTGKARGIKLSSSHAHCFRHLYANLLVNSGVSEADIAQLLGHQTSITSYYTASTEKELLKKIEKIDI